MYQNIIIISKDNQYETWGSLTEICSNYPEFSYHTLKGKKYPFTYKGYDFIKTKFKTRVIQ